MMQTSLCTRRLHAALITRSSLTSLVWRGVPYKTTSGQRFSSGSGGQGASDGDKEDAAPRKRSLLLRFFALGTLIGGSLVLLGKDEATNTYSVSLTETPLRAWQRVRAFFTSFEEPAFEKLLPAALVDAQHPRPYTLVIDLDKFLVCHIWDREQGRWRIAKREGAEVFLFYAAQLFEVVLFSALPQHEGDAIVKKLDPYGCISYSLFRFATKHRNGAFLKDISHLNRDPAKVVVLGCDAVGFSPHPENFIAMPPWLGTPEDAQGSALEASIDFLEMLAFSRATDVRPIIRQFAHKPFPETFDRSQQESFDRLKERQERSLQGRLSHSFSPFKSASQSKKGAVPPSGSTAERHADAPSAAPASAYVQRKAERMEMRRREFAQIRALMEKQLKDEMAKEKEYYAEHKVAVWDLFTRGRPQPPPPTAPPTA